MIFMRFWFGGVVVLDVVWFWYWVFRDCVLFCWVWLSLFWCSERICVFMC